ncbi:MAG: type VI secretion system contractile sheath large subunit [Gammaproteobacteria bacterium]|nr:type VI secretion system contractile sheath large subunit [Gammaproteobacteria bacterium]
MNAVNEVIADRVQVALVDEDAEGGYQVELPFRLLVLGNFSGADSDAVSDRLTTITVSHANVESLLKQFHITLDMLLDLGGIEVDAVVNLESFSDFLPQMLLHQVAPLQLIHHCCEALADGETLDLSDKPAWLQQLLQQCGAVGGDDAFPALVSLSLLRRAISHGISSILHDERFLQLETLWRDLLELVGGLGSHCCSVDILDVTYQQLESDCGGKQDVEFSQLYHLLYNIEYGQFGGVPYSAVVLAFSFGPQRPQVRLLEQLAFIGSRCHLLFIAQAAASFFNIDSIRQLSSINGITELLQGPSYIYWRAFQERDNARYVALTLPGVLRRLPYRAEAAAADLSFNEAVSGSGSKMIWGSAAFDYALCMVRSYQQFGTPIDAVGKVGGRIYRPSYLQGSASGYPFVNLVLSERRERELAELGFLPLTLDASGEFATFYSANSVHWGSLRHLAGERENILNRRLGAQLPYLLMIARVAHYLKVIQRDRLGSLATVEEIADELNHWLQQYVCDSESPPTVVRKRRPFRQALLTQCGFSDGEHWPQLELQLVPHTQHNGAKFALNLNCSL